MPYIYIYIYIYKIAYAGACLFSFRLNLALLNVFWPLTLCTQHQRPTTRSDYRRRLRITAATICISRDSQAFQFSLDLGAY